MVEQRIAKNSYGIHQRRMGENDNYIMYLWRVLMIVYIIAKARRGAGLLFLKLKRICT